MTTTKALKLFLLLLSTASVVTLSSCKKDEHGPHDDHDHSENEIITTVQIAFKDSASNIIGEYF